MLTTTNPPLLTTDVLIVGAGPTGLMTGLVLARRGVDALVIDGKSGPTTESRALVVQARSMEIYDQLGLAEQVLAGATPAGRIQIGAEAAPGGADFATSQSGWTPFPGAQIFEQSQNEELLSATLEAEGHPVRWGLRLTSLEAGTGSEDEHVEVLAEGQEGPVRIRARRLIGADGASSPVRHALDLPFEGVTDDATFCVADLRGVSGIPEDSLAARFGQQRFAVTFPMGPGGHVRLVWLHGGEDPEQEEALAAVREDLDVTYEQVDWFSAYRVHHRVAANFRRGAVFLAGDAAHVHSPVGGQGMNTGLQDAHHLANLLADVSAGHLGPDALERYERERRPVALTLITATDRAFGVIARSDRGTAFLRRRARDVLSVLAPRVLASPLGPRLGGLLGQYRIRYHAVAEGEQVPRWASDRAVGVRLPPTSENAQVLRSMSWQLHTYSPGTANRPAVPDWIEGPFAFSPDELGRLREDRLYLVRPDGFVAASFPLHAGASATSDVRDALASYDVVG
ncbi:FAD-dependent monooxygenase [Brachybacterium sacelli]|uniref:2-polyprenyl-6-methoxyphenol hydroxylase-like FAD-dependent oxidoreductase n=1 Tax=Brachybacterium sacelli TaxID=173364 RepID=A0ABS4X0J9_9MICO|nr:FAD-dependent monooxygenase [Brachybacterium sacelli]MBP2381249.1 2-polyprenyl-6-methoxyphenol hydroxylase-like FAD-dependent oxidoreductase [Brachybacterium sacelli]